MAIPLILILDRALRDAGIPITGVSVGTLSDRATWKAYYPDAATDAQKAQGDALLLTVDVADPTLLNEVRADLSAIALNEVAIRAIVQGVWEAIPSATLTLAQLRTRIQTIYRSLI